jgi:adenylate cyclase
MSSQNDSTPDDAGAGALDELNARLARKNEEIRIIQQISAEVIATLELDEILEVSLKTMETALDFKHCMIILASPPGEVLQLAASRGYETSGVGAEVNVGQGVIGVAAKRRRVMRMGNIQSQLTYLSAVRTQMQASGQSEEVHDMALPGLPSAQSQIAIPLVIRDHLVGVFAVEADRPNAFDELDEFLLSNIANQVAGAIDNARLHEQEIERAAQLDRAVEELSSLNESLESKVDERTADLSSALSEVKREKDLSENLLSRMAPPEVIPLMLEDKLAAGKLNTTVLFSDLEGFTEFSSEMEPDEICSRLNHFFSWSGKIINRYRGYVNKTNGDGIMALFGVPYENASHADWLSVIDEVNQFKLEHFSMVDFLSIQSRDGALKHNEAVAAFVLALLRSLRAGDAPVEGLDGIDEVALMRAALLHDVGKHAVAVERLNERVPSSEDREKLGDDLLAATEETLGRLNLPEVAAVIAGLTLFERTGGADGEFYTAVEILAAADIFDAITAPKYYKGTPWRITGALEELLHLPYCQRAVRPVFAAFAALMKPTDASISVRPATKAIFQ